MGWGYEIGRVYNRRNDIHGRFDGQQQGGIITPAKHALVILITGEEGLEHGYSDRYRPDGVFEYFGEGQIGNMQMRGGNIRVLEHSANGKSLLLFRKVSSGLRFEGEMVCQGFHMERAPDRDNVQRDAIVFELKPLEALLEHNKSEPLPAGLSLNQLRQNALNAAARSTNGTTQSPRNIYQRSRDVQAYVLCRSNGNCEGCHVVAPFLRVDGTPYLETHHLLRVSDGGPDHPSHVIALCPNCHRRVHAGSDGDAYNQELIVKMTSIEPDAG